MFNKAQKMIEEQKPNNSTETAILPMQCYVPLILEGTAACSMRDELKKARFEKKITLKEITDKLSKMELPKWLQSQILQMSNHRKYDRITCPIEQAMEAAVNYHIVNELMNEGVSD
jgi:hypothetical protein